MKKLFWKFIKIFTSFVDLVCWTIPIWCGVTYSTILIKLSRDVGHNVMNIYWIYVFMCIGVSVSVNGVYRMTTEHMEHIFLVMSVLRWTFFIYKIIAAKCVHYYLIKTCEVLSGHMACMVVFKGIHIKFRVPVISLKKNPRLDPMIIFSSVYQFPGRAFTGIVRSRHIYNLYFGKGPVILDTIICYFLNFRGCLPRRIFWALWSKTCQLPVRQMLLA